MSNVCLSACLSLCLFFCLSLSLKATKTQQIFIGSHNSRKISERNSCIHIHDQQIERVSSCKALEVIVDKRLPWSVHFDYIYEKVSSAIGVLRQISDFMREKAAISVYNGLIQPCLTIV